MVHAGTRVFAVVDRSYRIEPLGPDTSEAAGRLVTRILTEEFPRICLRSDLADMHNAYSRSGSAAWVALATDGTVAGTTAVAETDAGSLKLKRLYVDTSWRGAGLGTTLLEVAHNWAIGNGFQHLVLTTTDRMCDAQRLYTSHGYSRSHTEERDGTVYINYSRTIGVRSMGTRLPISMVFPPEDGNIRVVVERPRGYVEGWHHDTEAGDLVLSEQYPLPVPVNYGFTPDWINPADGDALDVIILDDRRMKPGDALLCQPVGVLWRPDDDHKLLAVPKGGAEVPVPVDESTKGRVAAWWSRDNQPTGWSGIENVNELLNMCRKQKWS